ncbi:acylphosphatase-1-like [Littorina saxatilis]|uniref:acylphosphatase n=1 Tax=Littorina saxatilis TaxID=31220 RepID=A0AAN9GDD3_9CAEN
MASGRKLLSVDFEVFGKVQGVFFRKHTQKTANELGVVGWVRNTQTKTVKGTMQGPPDKVEKLKIWLRTKGSPSSKITKCDFKNERELSSSSYSSFDITK